MPKTPHAFLWLDLETTGLDMEQDQILEVGVILTDFDLNKIDGYQEVIKLTKQGAERLRANDVVKKMHQENGLIKESAAATLTLPQVEEAIIKWLKEDTTFDKGEFMLAGSGNAAFDFAWIKKHMPQLASWVAYYPADVGIFRRMVRIFNGGRDVIGSPAVSNDGHRSMSDLEYYIEEAKLYRDWVGNAESALADKAAAWAGQAEQ
jgi:oligoribonuclease